MLINKSSTYSNGDIAVFKVVNGDEIVAEIVSVEDDAYTIRRPQTVVPSQKGMGLMPSLFTARDDHNIQLNKRNVILTAPAVDEMARHYKQTVSGLVLP